MTTTKYCLVYIDDLYSSAGDSNADKDDSDDRNKGDVQDYPTAVAVSTDCS